MVTRVGCVRDAGNARAVQTPVQTSGSSTSSGGCDILRSASSSSLVSRIGGRLVGTGRPEHRGAEIRRPTRAIRHGRWRRGRLCDDGQLSVTVGKALYRSVNQNPTRRRGPNTANQTMPTATPKRSECLYPALLPQSSAARPARIGPAMKPPNGVITTATTIRDTGFIQKALFQNLFRSLARGSRLARGSSGESGSVASSSREPHPYPIANAARAKPSTNHWGSMQRIVRRGAQGRLKLNERGVSIALARCIPRCIPRPAENGD